MRPLDSRFSLQGRNALVTGASRGIGRAIAEGFSAAGASIALVGRDAKALAEVQHVLPRADSFIADITDEAQIEEVVQRAHERLGSIDILVNAAGVSPVYAKAERLERTDWQLVQDTNLTGTFLCCRAVGRLMLSVGKGSIINVSSIAGVVGLNRLAAYAASKGGIELLTRTLAIEWAARGVRVNTLAPAFIRTDFTRNLLANESIRTSLLAQTPLGRIGEVDDVVGPAIFLASDSSRYVTGHTLLVDGGWTAR